MRAEVLDLQARFDVQPDGSSEGPPARLTISMRPCWRKPPVKLELLLAYVSEGVAYYGVLERTGG